LGLKLEVIGSVYVTIPGLKSDHFGIEITINLFKEMVYDLLKSDHFGIEIKLVAWTVVMIILLKSDHFGIEIGSNLQDRS